MIRTECGTVRGLIQHQAEREWPCGWCVHAEQVARLMAERVTPSPAQSPLLEPLTAAQARANAWLLDHEVAEFEREHQLSGRSRWLKRVA